MSTGSKPEVFPIEDTLVPHLLTTSTSEGITKVPVSVDIDARGLAATSRTNATPRTIAMCITGQPDNNECL